MLVRSFVESYESKSLWSECMRELCNKDSGCYENAWGLYKAKHLSIVSKSVEDKYNTISSLLFLFYPLSLCVVRVWVYSILSGVSALWVWV